MDGKLITYGVLMGYLVYAARKDIKTKRVSLKMAKIAGIAAVILWIFYRQTGFWEWILGLLPGLGLLALSYASREAIGYGDGVVACVCGLFLGFWGSMQVLIMALFFSGPVSMFLIVCGRARRRMRIAFVPFLLLGYIGWLIMKI